MDKKIKKEKKLTCKYGCGASYECNPEGQAALMRHYQYDCPIRKKQRTNEKTSETDRLEMSDVLEKILREVSQSRKIPAIIRMVKPHIDDPKRSFEVLAEALRLADFRVTDSKLILQNWAQTLGISSDKVLKDDQEEIQGDEKKLEGKTLDSSLTEEAKLFQLARIKKERMLLERKLETPKEEEKHILVVDGVELRLTPMEILAWKKYLFDKEMNNEDRLRETRKADFGADIKKIMDFVERIDRATELLLQRNARKRHWWSRK